MDKLPLEITVHILSYFKDPSAIKNFRTVCKAFYQLNMAEKSQFIIKAMPANSLDLLSTMTSKSKKKFSLIFRSPTLAMQKIPNKFINTLTGLNNLTGLDISSFKLPLGAQTKLVQLTNLERLSIESSEVNLSTLVRLSKLEIRDPNQSYSYSYQYLTNLLDLSIRNWTPERPADISCLHNLTRLSIQFPWVLINGDLNLTTMSKLKDLSIRSYNPYSEIKLVASCTTLESIDIEPSVNNFDFDWISSNTRLTNFMVKTDYSDAAQIMPLTNLNNLLSMKIYHMNQLHILSDPPRGITNLETISLGHTFSPEDLVQYTNLRSIELKSQYLEYFPTTLTNLTKITWSNLNVSNTAYPTSVKELDTGYIVKNLKDLTKLESLTLFSTSSNIGPDIGKLKHLTKLVLSFKDSESASTVLPNLSNLLSLKELSVMIAHNYQGINAEFLTTLTNLEALIIPSLRISLQVFDKIVQRQTQLTLLRVNCPDAGGVTLTRLTNLQELAFYSAVPMKGWKTMLEEKLSRLTTEILP